MTKHSIDCETFKKFSKASYQSVQTSEFFLSTETVVYHDFPNETVAGNCNNPRCANHSITYDVTLPQIAAVIEQSAECRQFIKVFGEN